MRRCAGLAGRLGDSFKIALGRSSPSDLCVRPFTWPFSCTGPGCWLCDLEAVADAKQLEGLPLEGDGDGDEPEARQRGVGGAMGFRQIVPRSASRVAKLCTGRSPGVRLVAALARARGERAAGSTALVRAAGRRACRRR